MALCEVVECRDRARFIEWVTDYRTCCERHIIELKSSESQIFNISKVKKSAYEWILIRLKDCWTKIDELYCIHKEYLNSIENRQILEGHLDTWYNDAIEIMNRFWLLSKTQDESEAAVIMGRLNYLKRDCEARNLFEDQGKIRIYYFDKENIEKEILNEELHKGINRLCNEVYYSTAQANINISKRLINLKKRKFIVKSFKINDSAIFLKSQYEAQIKNLSCLNKGQSNILFFHSFTIDNIHHLIIEYLDSNYSLAKATSLTLVQIKNFLVFVKFCVNNFLIHFLEPSMVLLIDDKFILNDLLCEHHLYDPVYLSPNHLENYKKKNIYFSAGLIIMEKLSQDISGLNTKSTLPILLAKVENLQVDTPLKDLLKTLFDPQSPKKKRNPRMRMRTEVRESNQEIERTLEEEIEKKINEFTP